MEYLRQQIQKHLYHLGLIKNAIAENKDLLAVPELIKPAWELYDATKNQGHELTEEQFVDSVYKSLGWIVGEINDGEETEQNS